MTSNPGPADAPEAVLVEAVVISDREGDEIIEVVEEIEVGREPHHHHEVRITVNSQFVTLQQEHVTGLRIKEAAIRDGVPIQLDFVLSEVKPGGEQKIIADDHEVHLKAGDEFWAIPGDDNS